MRKSGLAYILTAFIMISMLPVMTVTVSADPAKVYADSMGNLLQNGTFENNVTDGWTIINGAVVSKDMVNTNNKSAGSAYIHEISAWSTIAQTVTLRKNQWYKYSAAIKLAGGTSDQTASLVLDFGSAQNATDQMVSGQYLYPILNKTVTASGWTVIDGYYMVENKAGTVLTGAAESVTPTFYPKVGNDTVGVDYYIDNISVTKVTGLLNTDFSVSKDTIPTGTTLNGNYNYWFCTGVQAGIVDASDLGGGKKAISYTVANNFGNITQNVAIEKNKEYELSLWFKVQGYQTGDKMGMVLDKTINGTVSGDNYAYPIPTASASSYIVNGQWQHIKTIISYTGTARANGDARLYLRLNDGNAGTASGRVILMTDIEVKERTNLVTNPYFSINGVTNSAADWPTTSFSVVTDENIPGGTYDNSKACGKIVMNSIWRSPTRRVMLEKYKPYLISAWIKLDESVPLEVDTSHPGFATHRVGTIFVNHNAVNTGQVDPKWVYVSNQMPLSIAQWTKMQAIYYYTGANDPAYASDISFRVGYQGKAYDGVTNVDGINQGAIYFSDFTVQELTEQMINGGMEELGRSGIYDGPANWTYSKQGSVSGAANPAAVRSGNYAFANNDPTGSYALTQPISFKTDRLYEAKGYFKLHENNPSNSAKIQMLLDYVRSPVQYQYANLVEINKTNWTECVYRFKPFSEKTPSSARLYFRPSSYRAGSTDNTNVDPANASYYADDISLTPVAPEITSPSINGMMEAGKNTAAPAYNYAGADHKSVRYRYLVADSSDATVWTPFATGLTAIDDPVPAATIDSSMVSRYVKLELIPIDSYGLMGQAAITVPQRVISLDITTGHTGTLAPSGILAANVQVANHTGDTIPVRVVIAYYDGQGRLSKISLQDKIVEDGISQPFDPAIVLPAVLGGEAKIFVWRDQLGSGEYMQPLTDAYPVH